MAIGGGGMNYFSPNFTAPTILQRFSPRPIPVKAIDECGEKATDRKGRREERKHLGRALACLSASTVRRKLNANPPSEVHGNLLALPKPLLDDDKKFFDYFPNIGNYIAFISFFPLHAHIKYNFSLLEH